jgi:hypothetical protein
MNRVTAVIECWKVTPYDADETVYQPLAVAAGIVVVDWLKTSIVWLHSP